jgi:uncharacterized membrane protein
MSVDDAPWFPVDLLVVAVIAGGSLLTVLYAPPFEAVLRPLFVLPLLVFGSGYAVVAALFPGKKDEHAGVNDRVRIDWYERLSLSVATSVAASVFAGITLDFTIWPITLANVVAGLAAVTAVGVVVGAIRRLALPPDRRFGLWRFRRAGGPPSLARSLRLRPFPALATLAVAFAVVLTLSTVVAVTVSPRQGETFTEVGLLVEDDETGALVAEGYPQRIPQNQQRDFVLSIQNREGRTVTYSVVVELERVGPEGEVGRSVDLGRFERTLADGESARIDHSIAPPFSGDRLRLTYLLYEGDPPDEPTVDGAKRELHLWIAVPGTDQPEAGDATSPPENATTPTGDDVSLSAGNATTPEADANLTGGDDASE